MYFNSFTDCVSFNFRDLAANKEQLVFKANAENAESLELRVLKIIVVSLVCKVFLAQLYGIVVFF